MWSAPTAAEAILELHGDLTIACEPCRLVRAPVGLLERLAAGRHARTPIDRLIFRCHACAAVGQPIAQAPGNILMGRAQLWPPAESGG